MPFTWREDVLKFLDQFYQVVTVRVKLERNIFTSLSKEAEDSLGVLVTDLLQMHTQP